MTDAALPVLDAAALVRLAKLAPAQGCTACASLVAPGWESLPGGFDRAVLERVGTLRDPADEDPTVEEFHPAGTNAWSRDAPIAPLFFPYNRSDVWRCRTCGCLFLRYTEHGGYYSEERIRRVDAALVAAP